ncbi:dimethylglycine dehydrogenase, mitochondrial [Trichonephila clavipes]|nr:dimethylglycine dehydrogenase, mitochondrial [Trichonephila clavipes]
MKQGYPISSRNQSNSLWNGTNAVSAQDYGNSVLELARCFAGGLNAAKNNDQLRCLLRNSTEALKSIAKQTAWHITEPPVLRDLEGSFYMRTERGGLLVGPYEEKHKMKVLKNWHEAVPKGFGKELFQPDLDRLSSHLEAAMSLVPELREVDLHTVVNGPIMYTPDLLPLLGPYYDLPNMWMAVGFGCQVIYSQFRLAIHQNDHQARRRFVEWAQNKIAVVPDFHKRILFSDEAHFWLNGYVNKQNCRIWSEANPQVYVETPLHPEKLTVLCALWAGGILLQKR